MIRTAKVIESKIKIRSIPVEHLRFMGVHDAAHANIEGGASQQGHLILVVHARYQIADCLTKHASRKSEAVLQKVLK